MKSYKKILSFVFKTYLLILIFNCFYFNFRVGKIIYLPISLNISKVVLSNNKISFSLLGYFL